MATGPQVPAVAVSTAPTVREPLIVGTGAVSVPRATGAVCTEVRAMARFAGAGGGDGQADLLAGLGGSEQQGAAGRAGDGDAVRVPLAVSVAPAGAQVRVIAVSVRPTIA